jgi:hypothetical protein
MQHRANRGTVITRIAPRVGAFVTKASAIRHYSVIAT